MSFVTNVIAVFGLCANENDDELLEEINSLNYNRDTGLKMLGSPECGGDKCLESNCAIGAFNHLWLEEWVQRIREEIQFEEYGCNYLQFIVQEDNDTGFGIIDVYKGKDFHPYQWREQ